MHVDFGHHDFHPDEKGEPQGHHGQLVPGDAVSAADIASGLYRASATHVINPSFGFSEEEALVSLRQQKNNYNSVVLKCESNIEDIDSRGDGGHSTLEPSKLVNTDRGNGCFLM